MFSRLALVGPIAARPSARRAANRRAAGTWAGGNKGRGHLVFSQIKCGIDAASRDLFKNNIGEVSGWMSKSVGQHHIPVYILLHILLYMLLYIVVYMTVYIHPGVAEVHKSHNTQNMQVRNGTAYRL